MNRRRCHYIAMYKYNWASLLIPLFLLLPWHELPGPVSSTSEISFVALSYEFPLPLPKLWTSKSPLFLSHSSIPKLKMCGLFSHVYVTFYMLIFCLENTHLTIFLLTLQNSSQILPPLWKLFDSWAVSPLCSHRCSSDSSHWTYILLVHLFCCLDQCCPIEI